MTLFLEELADRGWTKDDTVALLTRELVAFGEEDNSEAEDAVLDALDRVTDWCPSWRTIDFQNDGDA